MASLVFTTLLFATIIETVHSCVASGVCGLGPCYAPTIPCMQGSCSSGYSCGNYGCARRRVRAHSGRTVQGPALFGLNRFSPVQQNTSPDEKFMRCCEGRGLPDACLQKCTFQTYTKEALTSMYFKADACPIEASAEIQFCAAQGRDHRDCCARNGVTTTLAGNKCLTFCDQRPGNVTQLDMSYISCYERFEEMKSCFWHDMNRYGI
uniref:DB domain-containing protein n=1 Tax=Steinernema glaseri TaxID=37863 RepID=A0A1I7XWS8_9BILA